MRFDALNVEELNREYVVLFAQLYKRLPIKDEMFKSKQEVLDNIYQLRVRQIKLRRYTK
jgi:hypothetical protein